MATPIKKKKPHGSAQDAFVKKTRAKVALDSLFFERNNWMLISNGEAVRSACLNRSSGAPVTSVNRFCVKDLAGWMPRRIIKTHMPGCPGCGNSEFVQPMSAWVGCPKTSFGLRRHHHLDSICHECHRQPECEGRTFSGCNPKSLEN